MGPSPVPTPDLSRRGLLRIGGLTVTLGALATACGDRGGDTSPGLIGDSPVAPTLPEAAVTDVALLRTASSLEYTALAVYAAAGGLGVLDGYEAVVERFVADHTAHAGRFDQLTEDAGGTPWTCPNPWLEDRVTGPILERIVGNQAASIPASDDPARDVLNVAHALESLAGAAYQSLVPLLSVPDLRRAAMLIGAQEVRHAATLAMAVTGTPTGYVSPALTGGEVVEDEAGFLPYYAIPGAFGSLAPITLAVGARDENGARWKINVETPAANSIMFEYLQPSC